MGAASWIVSALAAFAVARLVPAGRTSRWIAELAVAIGAAIGLGLTATALDFGGWRTIDGRAALFIVCGSFAAIGVLRAVRPASRDAAPC